MADLIDWSFAVPDRWALFMSQSSGPELGAAAARLADDPADIGTLIDRLETWRDRLAANDVHMGAAWVPERAGGVVAGIAEVTLVLPDEPLTPASVRADLATWSSLAAGAWDVDDVDIAAGLCVLGHGFLVAEGDDLGQVEETVHAVVLPAGTSDALEITVTSPLVIQGTDLLDDVLALLAGLQVVVGEPA